MPELPEVETIRRQLEPALVGRRIRRLSVLDERWTRPHDPAGVERAVTGRRVEAVERRGKYLILRLEGDLALVMHLRMTGNIVVDRSTATPPYLRARIELDDGSVVWFTDARRFGQGVVLEGGEVEAFFSARLGIEPLSPDLTAEALCRLARGRRAPLKSFLLAQGGIAGIGNIYADEALHRAELHPLSPAGSLRPEDCERLREGIVEALEEGLRNGGASVDDYRDARGERGTMQEEFLVHTREGKPCPRCGEEIRRVVVAGRSTYFCPGCQRRLRRRPRGTRRRPTAIAR
jgi:formamidopyrimidine-DNA glycosylase